MLGHEVFQFDTGRPMINYGINKVRFPSPVRVDSRIRATVTIAGVQPVAVGTQLTMAFVIEIEGEAKPACVAETVILSLSPGEGRPGQAALASGHRGRGR